MTDIQRVLDSKRTYRERVAALPICDKLRMLDTLRERELSIRGRLGLTQRVSTHVREPSIDHNVPPQ